MAKHDKQVNVRLAHELVEKVKEEATNKRQSFTAQLNDIIEEWSRNRKQERKEIEVNRH